MGDTVELQTMGKRSFENHVRVETSGIMVSLRTIILTVVMFMVIFSTVIISTIYLMQSTSKVAHSLTVDVNNEVSKTKQRKMEMKISTLELAHFINNLQLEYVEQMNQNLSHTLFLNQQTLLELHNATKYYILEMYDAAEKPFVEKEAEIVAGYKNQLLNKIDKSFAALSHDHTFKRLASEDWNLANETKEQIKRLYDENTQLALSQYDGRDPPEVSFEFQKNVSEMAISDGVSRKLVPPSSKVKSELRSFLNAEYHEKIGTHAVIGIDFGESYTNWFYYYNGELHGGGRSASYVGAEEYKGYPQYQLKSNIRGNTREVFPIFYDLKEIIRCWNSFKTSSDKLFWSFDVKEGPLVSSAKTKIQHSVQALLSKLFQKVLELARSRSYHHLSTVNSCVIATPSDFVAKQKELILDAGKMAGFQKVTLLDEDIAAALTLQRVRGPWNVAKTIMYIELNQLSWNIYVLEGYQSSYSRIISKSYNNSEDLVYCCIKEYCQTAKCYTDDVEYDGSIEARIRWRRLYEYCEYAIFDFSHTPTSFRYSVWGVSNSVNIYRNSTEKAIKDKLEPFTRFIDANLKQANIAKESIDDIIMGGKYGTLWAIQEVISEYFSGRNLTIKGVTADNTIAYGAAVRGLELTAEAIKQSRLNETVV